jgi:hypothetical protein
MRFIPFLCSLAIAGCASNPVSNLDATPTNDFPNPYRTVAPWGKLPANHDKWGATVRYGFGKSLVGVASRFETGLDAQPAIANEHSNGMKRMEPPAAILQPSAPCVVHCTDGRRSPCHPASLLDQPRSSAMKHRLKITLATAAFAVATVVLVNDALAATDAESRSLALAAYDQAALERDRPRRESMESAAARAARLKAVQLEVERLCQIQPVMTDAEIEGCKRAYAL